MDQSESKATTQHGPHSVMAQITLAFKDALAESGLHFRSLVVLAVPEMAEPGDVTPLQCGFAVQRVDGPGLPAALRLLADRTAADLARSIALRDRTN